MEIDTEQSYAPPTNLDDYIKQYTGHGKYHVLLRLARHSVSEREQALKLCIDLAKQDKKLK